MSGKIKLITESFSCHANIYITYELSCCEPSKNQKSIKTTKLNLNKKIFEPFFKFGSSATIKLTLIGLHPMEGDIVLDLDVTEVGPPFGQAELHHVPLLPPVDGDSKLEIKQIHVQK